MLFLRVCYMLQDTDLRVFYNKLHVTNLPASVRITHTTKVIEHFKQWGELAGFVLPRDPITKQLKGYAIVTYEVPLSAEAAVLVEHQVSGGGP